MIRIFSTFTSEKSVFHPLWHPTNNYITFRWRMAKTNPGFNAPNSKMRGSDYILTDVHNGINLKISWQFPLNKPRLLFPQEKVSMPFFRIQLMTRHWKRRKFAQKRVKTLPETAKHRTSSPKSAVLFMQNIGTLPQRSPMFLISEPAETAKSA